MDPTSIVSTISSVVKAAEAIEKQMEAASKLAKDDAQYYSAYIEVAALAVRGLENEYLEILKQAEQSDLNDIQQIEMLQKRISDYVNGELLRPRLTEAIDRLEIGRTALAQHTKGLPIWPKVRDRNAALAKFDKLLNEFHGYLGSLGNYIGPSAAALQDLKDLTIALSGPQEAAQQKICDLLTNLDKSRLFTTTGSCYRVIETLRLAFR